MTRWQDEAPSKAGRLFTLLSDGRAHTNRELARICLRFGARLKELHGGAYGRELHYIRLIDSRNTALVSYRKTTAEHCSVCNRRPTKSLRSRVRELEMQLKRYRERLSEWEGWSA